MFKCFHLSGFISVGSSLHAHAHAERVFRLRGTRTLNEKRIKRKLARESVHLKFSQSCRLKPRACKFNVYSGSGTYANFWIFKLKH